MTHSYVSWKQWHGHDFGYYSHETALYFELELRQCGLGKIDGLKVGELGFGNGAFAGWVRDQKGNWIGREAIQVLSDRAAAKGFVTVGPHTTFAGTLGSSALDAIVAFDVLEHLGIDQIKNFLNDAWIALNPGGILIARLPSGDSPFVGQIFHGDLTHRTLLGSSAVKQLAGETGFEVLQQRAPAFPLMGFGLNRKLRRLIVYGLQTMVAWCVRSIIMGNSQAVISPNMLVVLGKPVKPPSETRL